MALKHSFACDPGKRVRLANQRGFDLLEVVTVFEDPARLDFADTRCDYGEARRVAIGRALGRVFTVVYTVRVDVVWLITAWPASRRERARYEAE